jgi:hypothetical protein
VIIANLFRPTRKLAPLLLTPAIAVTAQTPKPAATSPVVTTVVLTITSPTTMYYGQTVDGSAQVSSTDGSTLSGTITFYDGATSICVLAIAPAASCPASAGEGFATETHNLTAVYSGDTTHAASTSNDATITVLKDTTAAVLTASSNPATAGQNITLTATIQGAHATPTGNVTFYDGTSPLATAALNANGTAVYSTNALPAGKHSLRAVFGPTENFDSVTSPDLSEVIQSPAAAPTGPASFSIGVGSVSVVAGETVSIPVTFSNGTLKLACSNLPDEATCVFSSPAASGSGSKAALLLKTAAPRDCGTTAPYGTANLPFAAPVAAGLFILFLPKRRPFMRGLLTTLITVGVLTTMTGCGTGNCTDLGTRPGVYKITITGTSTGSIPTVISQQVLLNVTI